MSFNAKTDRRLNLPAGVSNEARPATIVSTVVEMKAKPESSKGIDTQLLLGTTIRVFQEENGWALVQADADGYVGFLPLQALAETNFAPTHIISVPRTFRYAIADMKTPHVDPISIGSRMVITGFSETRGTQYAITSEGHSVIAKHILPIDKVFNDPVAVAETLIHTPYLWGGASAFGIDCSGLVQLCFAMCGVQVLRDTDMQAATAGRSIEASELRRGDLIFWKGHVAIYRGAGSIIHANGHSMTVAVEDMDVAISRIAYLYGEPVSYRRVALPI